MGSDALNKLLYRQLSKSGISINELPANCAALLQVVSDSYNHFERDRKMLERSIDLSSQDMKDLFSKLQSEIEVTRSTHQDLKSLLENIEEVFFSLDVKKNCVIQVSKACKRILGYSPEDLKEKPTILFDLVTKDSSSFSNAVLTKIDSRFMINKQVQVNHSDGTKKWLELKITPSWDDGELVRIDGAGSDITSRKEAEEKLEKSERKFRSMIEHTSDGITIMDNQSNIVYASDSVQKILGYSAEEVMNIRCFDLIHPDDIEITRKHMEYIMLNHGVPSSITHRMKHKNGSYIWCDRVCMNMLWDTAVSGIVSNFRDVTDSKNHQDILEKTNETLTRANQELDYFVYSVSHDLRAPLLSIKGLADMTTMNTEEALTQKHMGMIGNSVNKLDRFIGEILDYSRNSRTEVILEKINSHQLLSDTLAEFAFLITESGIDVEIDCEEEEEILVDKFRIQVILNNLISNSIRYSDSSKSRNEIKIKCILVEETIEISVEDNGIGIADEHISKVFNMFYRATRNSNGSGLGLYIVQQAINKINGSISLRSKKGEGTSITLKIPIQNKFNHSLQDH